MKYKFLIIVIASVTTIIILAAAISRGSADFLENRAMISVRLIGHQLLMANQDSTSRILPVKQLGKGVFQLEFESKFKFSPDTLVAIVKSSLQALELPVNYLVNVFECDSHEIVYAFEVNPNKTDIIPCLGREQPEGCYNIQIAVIDLASSSNSMKKYFPYAIVVVGIGFIVFFSGGLLLKREAPIHIISTKSIIIGNTTFIPENRQLKIRNEFIDLSDKETKLLKILAAQPNQLILRDRLLKEVWEDEGVITGRSLDMFISKLRKKLKDDSSISIVNAHGQGYRLEVVN